MAGAPTGIIGGMAGLLASSLISRAGASKMTWPWMPRKIARKLHHIAEPLFRVHQQRAVAQRLALPLRLGKRPAWNGARPEPLLPAIPGLIRTAQQQH